MAPFDPNPIWEPADVVGVILLLVGVALWWMSQW